MKRLIDSIHELLLLKTTRLDSDSIELISFVFVSDPAVGPTIPLGDYIQKLLNETRAGLEATVSAIYWIRKLQRQRPGLDVSEWTIRRLFLAAIVVAIKYCNDYYWNNYEYAIIGQTSLTDLNKLETTFAHDLMAWNLFIDHEHDQDFKNIYFIATNSELPVLI